MLTVYHSNRLEELADGLAAVVSRPLRSPLATETIIVQSNGMARWLSLHLARQLGVCANVRFPFPATFIWEVFRKVLPRVPETSGFSPSIMAWRLMGFLDDLGEDSRFAPLRSYLQDGDDFRRYELACRIADSFDQYLIYRPDWIRRWETKQGNESGGDEDWQAELWRRLVRADSGSHRVRLQQDFFAVLGPERVARARLPERIALFGIPAMPPIYLEIFQRLADYLEVHLFLLNPCQYYWGDIVPERDIGRRAGDQDSEALYLETGNHLLASLGKQGRDFIDLVQGEQQGIEKERFVEPGEDSLLHCLQSDILNLRNRGTEDCPATSLKADDRSVQIHACHSAMREVEVLHDQLLALFEANPGLQPADIAVMTPDIEAYAPYIEAVFATAEGERRIPFSIADRSFRTENRLADAFFVLLELINGRFDANQVLNLLETPAVQRRFGLLEDDLILVHRWVRETNIRWGIDPNSRARLGLPATAEHTWRAGLDRLLLGYALPENGRLFGEILPYDQIEGGSAQVMGRLQTFTQAVFQLQDGLDGQRPMADWVEVLQCLLDRFLEPGEDEAAQMQAIREALNYLTETTRQADFVEPVSLSVIKSALRRRLEQADSANRFLTGGVTFCAMVPMRSVPFQVVCLIGMNDGVYPRSQRPLGFDLMAHRFRRGDRSRRNDDRYLFLEALLSARHCLYLSFVGNSIRDNSIIPPSVLVSELLDTLRQGFLGSDGQGDILKQVVTRHPLQAFSRRYFNGEGRLFSYAQELCEASRDAGRGETAAAPFIDAALPEPDAQWQAIDPERLIRFLANPARYLLRQRLGIHLEESEGLLETREPFTLDFPASQDLRQTLLTLHLTGEPLPEALPIMRAGGKLPHGQVGITLFERQASSVTEFAARVERVLPAEILEPLEVDLRLKGMQLYGRLGDVSRVGLVGFRLDTVRPRDLLNLWVRHLLLNSVAPLGVEPVSRWLGEDREILLNPVANAPELLEGLLGIYWQGLSRPLHFFPRSSYACAEALDKGRDNPLTVARRVWEGSEYARGESDNPYYQLAFRGSDPLDAWFQELAEAVFRPLFDHLEDL